MRIKMKLSRPAIAPFKKYPDDAGYDLKADIKDGLIINPFEVVTIPTGVSMQIPSGYVGDIRPRSSLAKRGLTAEYGTIDSGYTGVISIVLTNNTANRYYIHPLDRIAQLVIVPIIYPEFEQVDELEDTPRKDNGFGSTGHN